MIQSEFAGEYHDRNVAGSMLPITYPNLFSFLGFLSGLLTYNRPPWAATRMKRTGTGIRFSNGSDLEPWRCRRTDGKKWRCAKDVGPNQKYSAFCLELEMLGKYKLHSSNNLDKVDEPSLNLQLVESDGVRLSKEIHDKNRELSRLRGQELQGLTLDELEHLETLLEGGLSRVLQTKDERLGNEISILEEKHKVVFVVIKMGFSFPTSIDDDDFKRKDALSSPEDQGQSSESVITNVYSCNSGPPLEDDFSDTSLKLG
ncbi:hypothetical protein L2E82_16449 [Cichorium intybus]|uniref:Uncharacterized protein n=1 Tax=Cichorium intybus TaxID=13427 RepID=A0ACB9F6W2_CICIN|nr:hypothetical protein L2E82_50241 [Cichorium intybus]KAI3766392.1 hypothetical protein L2E82_16449 [Cichorium intybus]